MLFLPVGVCMDVSFDVGWSRWWWWCEYFLVIIYPHSVVAYIYCGICFTAVARFPMYITFCVMLIWYISMVPLVMFFFIFPFFSFSLFSTKSRVKYKQTHYSIRNVCFFSLYMAVSLVGAVFNKRQLQLFQLFTLTILSA